MLFHASPQFVRMLDLEREQTAARERLANRARREHREPARQTNAFSTALDRLLSVRHASRLAEPVPPCVACPAAS